ncbi:hypothetical protein SSX86_021061 [Deinandra increscens subsp. villosa]|uniref:Uncharacterized protein n=1 Tax=Deinandra increscens subsp. villosa TaxID=3103831 RepID=A0AAP0GTU5_9ASTR
MKFISQEQVFILSPSEIRAPKRVPPLPPPSGFKPIPSPPLELVQPLLSSDLVIQHLNRWLMLRLGSGNTRLASKRRNEIAAVEIEGGLKHKRASTAIPNPRSSGNMKLIRCCSTIGAGVYILVGTVAREHSGPALAFSFLIASFDRGLNYLLVKSIQELRSKKEGIVAASIGGPSGSGKTSLTEKVASVIGCSVISMENYGTGSDEGNDLNSIDFDLLVQNLQEKLIHHLEMKCRPTYLTWNVRSPTQLSFSAREIGDGTFLKAIEDYEPVSKRLLKLYHGDPVLNLLTPWERPPPKNIFCIYEVDSRTEATHTTSRPFKPVCLEHPIKMACLNVQVKNENQGGFMDPRISFSNDFIDSNHHENSYREAPVSSDFEFSIPTFSSNSADEVLFKGKLSPPMKEKVVTLRDELLAGHDDDGGLFINNKNSSGWWREKFGLRKGQNGKSDNKNLGALETIDEAKIKPTFYGANFAG